MRRRLLASMLAVALAGIVVLGVPLGYVTATLVRTEATERLERHARLIGSVLEEPLGGGEAITTGQLARLVHPGERVELVRRDGRRVTAGTTVAGPAFRVREPASHGATVDVAIPEAVVAERIRAALLPIPLLGLVAVGVAAGLAVFQARRLGAPVSALARVSEELGAGSFGVRADPSGVAEVDAVAEALNRSASRIGELVEHERAFATNASHQLRTPLTALCLRLEDLLRSFALDEEVRVEVVEALSQAERLTVTVQQLLALARTGRGGQARPVDVGRVVAERARHWQAVFARAGRALAAGGDGPALAFAVPGVVDQALDVLLDNALRHGGGATSLQVVVANERVAVRVRDEGPGVADQLVRRIFERDVSGRADSGLGLGLPLARALVEADGGTLRLVSPRPATFEFSLPEPPTVPTTTDGHKEDLRPRRPR